MLKQVAQLRRDAAGERLVVIAQAVELATEGMARFNVPAMYPLNHLPVHVTLALTRQVEASAVRISRHLPVG